MIKFKKNKKNAVKIGCRFQCVQRGWISQKNVLSRFCATVPRAAPLPAKAELTLSEFLAVADGGRRERPMTKSLPRCLSFLVKRKRKQMHMEGGGGGTSCFFVTGSNGVCGKHGHRLKKKKHIQQHYWHETEAGVYTEGLTVCGIIYHKCIKAENATLRVCKSRNVCVAC